MSITWGFHASMKYIAYFFFFYILAYLKAQIMPVSVFFFFPITYVVLFDSPNCFGFGDVLQTVVELDGLSVMVFTVPKI